MCAFIHLLYVTTPLHSSVLPRDELSNIFLQRTTTAWNLIPKRTTTQSLKRNWLRFSREWISTQPAITLFFANRFIFLSKCSASDQLLFLRTPWFYFNFGGIIFGNSNIHSPISRSKYPTSKWTSLASDFKSGWMGIFVLVYSCLGLLAPLRGIWNLHPIFTLFD
jgi:hypothetical protein